MKLEAIFEKVAQQMQLDFEQTRNALEHPGLKGSGIENIFREFLRKYLPKSLDISSGILIDSNGEQSRQLDVIISDAARTPIFYEKGEVRVIPIECAYAVIEVKSNLDSEELKQAFTNMKSVRALKKAAYFDPRSINMPPLTFYGREYLTSGSMTTSSKSTSDQHSSGPKQVDNEHFHEQQNSLQNQQSFSLTQPFLKETNNLNSASFLDDMGQIFADIQDYSTVGSDGKTLVLFKRLEEHLIRFIQEADIILGCVAWLTSEPIL